MRVVLAPIAAFLCIAATGEAQKPGEEPKDQDAVIQELRDRIFEYRLLQAIEGALGIPKSNPLAQGLNIPSALNSQCRDRLEAVDEPERPTTDPSFRFSLPLFERKPDTASEPLAIYAVDRRENGCGVMVMMGNRDDIRPVPITNPKDYRLMPADGFESE